MYKYVLLSLVALYAIGCGQAQGASVHKDTPKIVQPEATSTVTSSVNVSNEQLLAEIRALRSEVYAIRLGTETDKTNAKRYDDCNTTCYEMAKDRDSKDFTESENHDFNVKQMRCWDACKPLKPAMYNGGC